MNSDILEYRLICPLDSQEVSPMVCKQCEKKGSCIEVSKLAREADMEKWKGTILGGGVNIIVQFRKKVHNFILDAK